MTPHQLESLLRIIRAEGSNKTSTIHGERHWQQVAWIGYYLMSETPGANPLLVLLFAMLHDSMRLNDGTDYGHGKRAAAFAENLSQRDFLRSQRRAFTLPEGDLHILMDACARHTDGHLSDDPTIAVCWDADRLNLWRIGRKPQPRFLSTQAAKRPVFVDWSEYVERQSFSWGKVFAKYSTLGLL
jgi:uncharacterized protein